MDHVRTRENLAPPLSALRAFVSAAHHMSFSKASEELGVTQSGVSRAIRSIEMIVGSSLFERTGHGLVLTEPGQRYLDRVRAILGDLETATIELATYRSTVASLTIASLPTFGVRFLIPRLGGFTRRHPEIQLTVVSRINPFEFERSGIDGAIHYGVDAWQGTLGDHLMDETLVPVASPQLLGGGDPRDRFPSLPLIQHTHRPTAWREWLREMNWHHAQPDLGICFEQYNMGIHAALAGLGAALMPLFLVRRELADGSLVALTREPVGSRWSYFFVYPEAKRSNPALQRFRAWLKQDVRTADAQRGMP
jgi:DNA-binding transcriptional LysR family regulator